MLAIPRFFYLSLSKKTDVNEQIHVVEASLNSIGFEKPQWHSVIEYWAYNQVVHELDKAREQRDKALKERDALAFRLSGLEK